jgi:hypothetical protein
LRLHRWIALSAGILILNAFTGLLPLLGAVGWPIRWKMAFSCLW